MRWNEEALQELEKVPGFVRSMAKRAVEKDVRKAGREEVTVEDVHKGRDKHIAFAEDKEDDPVTRIAVVRCETVSEVCPGVACGGCPGRRVSRLVDSLKKHRVDVIHLSSCMMLEGDYPSCPHHNEIKAIIESKGIKVVEGTHH